MKQARLKSGGFVNILDDGDKPIQGEINFKAKELAWARKVSVSTNDPEAEREFWRELIEKKKADANYDLRTDFPEVGSDAPADPTYTGAPSADHAQENTSKRRAFAGEAICRDTIEMLRGRGAKTKREREESA